MHKSAFSPRILSVYLLLIGALLLAIASLHHQQQQQKQLFEAYSQSLTAVKKHTEQALKDISNSIFYYNNAYPNAANQNIQGKTQLLLRIQSNSTALTDSLPFILDTSLIPTALFEKITKPVSAKTHQPAEDTLVSMINETNGLLTLEAAANTLESQLDIQENYLGNEKILEITTQQPCAKMGQPFEGTIKLKQYTTFADNINLSIDGQPVALKNGRGTITRIFTAPGMNVVTPSFFVKNPLTGQISNYLKELPINVCK
jgi:hypothetical protein